MKKNDEIKLKNFRLHKEVCEQILEYAQKKNISQTKVVELAIENYVSLEDEDIIQKDEQNTDCSLIIESLNKQLQVKDEQINKLLDTINKEQALHAGALQQSLLSTSNNQIKKDKKDFSPKQWWQFWK